MLKIRNDRKVLDTTFQNFRKLPDSITKSISDGVNHDIKDFLARPRLIHNFGWNTTDAIGDSIFNVTLPDGIITDRIFAAKVAGFAYMRATVVVRMMVNTQRFQAGRLMMTWMPLAKQNQTKFNDTKFLCYYSQRPRVEFDAATDTEVIMRIPYVHPALAFDLTSGVNSAGRLDVVVYGALTSGTARANLYYSFEDVELAYATEPGPFIAQSAMFAKSKVTGSDPGDREAAAMGVRPISSMLSSLATTASIGADIPLISSVAGPVSWAASVAAKAAHAFGYAKPLNLAPRLRTYQQADSHRINVDGAHMAVNYGLFEDNKISHLPGFAGTDLDEMAFSSFLGTYTYMGTAFWAVSSNEGSQIFSNMPLRPDSNPANTRTLTVANKSVTVRDEAPFGYLAKMFNLYRGSFKIKFKIVKTEFHSGRLRFNYYLQNDMTSTPNTTYNSANVHSSIFDLRDSNEFEVVIPYGAPTPYLPVGTQYARFNLAVETPLQAIGDVSTQVAVIMEWACADDFEFASPKVCNFLPCSTAFSIIEAQSGLGRSAEPLQDDREEAVEVGGAHVIRTPITPAELCIGEKILSARQLLKRMTRFLKLTQSQVGTDLLAYQSAKFSPWAVCIPNSLYDQYGYRATHLSTSYQPDYFNMFAVLFAMMRGSVRVSYRENCGVNTTFGNLLTVSWKAMSSSPSVTYPNDVTLTTKSDDTAINGYRSLAAPDEDVGTTFDSSYEDIQVPYYNRTHSSIVPISPWLVGDQSNPLSTGGPTKCLVPTTQVRLSGGILTTDVHTNPVYRWVYRAIGEDFSFGYFTGTYPLAPINIVDSPGRNVG